MKNRTPCVLAALAILAGCTRSVAYRASNETPDSQYTLRCLRACDGGADDRLACYASCPGIEVTVADSCDAVDPRTTYCTTRREADGTAVAVGLGSVVLGVAVLALMMKDFDEGWSAYPGSSTRTAEPPGGLLGATPRSASLSSPLAD